MKEPTLQEGGASLPTPDSKTPEQKRKEYLELMGLTVPPDAIIVLVAGIAERTRKDGKTIKWGPTAYNDETANFCEAPDQSKPAYGVRQSEQGNYVVGCGGGKARTIAAGELHYYFPVPIITTSRYPLKGDPEHQPPDEHWEVYQDYLKNVQQIPEAELLSERESTTTITGILNLIFMAHEKGWKNVVILANDFHLPRTQKFYDYLTDKEKATTLCKYILARVPTEYRKRMDYTVEGTAQEPRIVFASDQFFDMAHESRMTVVSAEEILKHRRPSYEKLLDKVEESFAHRQRVAMEQRGVDQLDTGLYMKPAPEQPA